MKIKLKNSEILMLQNEIRDLLVCSMKFLPKYFLTQLGEITEKVLDPYVKIHQELIKKFGKEDPETNQVMIKKFVDEEGKEMTEEFQEFSKEIKDILDQEIELDYNELPLSAFAQIDTPEGRFYPYIAKLIDSNK